MVKHVYVIGLDESNLRELQTVRHAPRYEFHPLIQYDRIVHPPRYDIDDILLEARQTLDHGPPADAIIGHWDFPTTSLLPILRKAYGLPTPTLESVLYCEHKYWSRLASAAALPECTPPFQPLDPYTDDPVADLRLPYPFWLKPAVAFSSYLGFRIDHVYQCRNAMATIRDNINRFAEPFDKIRQHAHRQEVLPAHGGGSTCVAEGLIDGRLCTLEGYVHHGHTTVYAVVDSLRAPNSSSFFAYQYPSQLPRHVQDRMIANATTIATHIGLDQTPFNMEFFWHEDSDNIWLLEINPRISKSHCPIFRIVTGSSHHEVAIDIAMETRPAFPRQEGIFPIAAKFMPRVFGDATVTRVPSDAEVQAVCSEFPDLVIHIAVREGLRLSELPGQDSYSYEIAELFLGAQSEAALHAKFRMIMRKLNFQFSDNLPTNYDVPSGPHSPKARLLLAQR